jgi:uncharacterized membrane protein
MNPSQIHLALTHAPIILSVAGFVILLVSFITKNLVVRKTALYIILFAGIISIPVYFSGEGTEELIEDLPGISHDRIEEHEEIAKIAFIAMLATGIAALISLALFNKRSEKTLSILTLVLALATSVIMAQTSHLGGQISHSEIRNEGTINTSEEESDHSLHQNEQPATSAEGVMDQSSALKLNNGAKWKTDVPTRENINTMKSLVMNVDTKDPATLQQLSTDLEAQTTKLISECRMKGPDHDALHVWLEDFQKDFKTFKASDQKQNHLASLKLDMQEFDRYFE